MSYGNLEAQIKYRGATNILRSKVDKVTYFEFNKSLWQCPFVHRNAMTQELSDGHEMEYCIKLYCSEADSIPTPTEASTQDLESDPDSD